MSQSPTAIIADDEPHLRLHLREMLAELWPQLHIVGEADNGIDALSLATQARADIAFLDIRMPGASGIEVAQQLKHRSALVFVTAYDEYAIDAFNSAAIDYLLKPIERPRLQETITRLQARLSQTPASGDSASAIAIEAALAKLTDQSAPSTPYLTWLKVNKGDQVLLLPVAEIDYFHADQKYVSAFHHGREYILRSSLAELEAQLDPQLFWRIHRSTIVRAAAVAHASKDFNGKFSLHLNSYEQVLAVSRNYAQRFKTH